MRRRQKCISMFLRISRLDGRYSWWIGQVDLFGNEIVARRIAGFAKKPSKRWTRLWDIPMIWVSWRMGNAGMGTCSLRSVMHWWKMVSQGVQKKPSKEVYMSGSRIKDHKRIKKGPSDPPIRVRGRNTLKQTVRLQSQTFMPIMPKRSGVPCAESAPPFGEKPICTPKRPRDYNGFYLSIGWSTIFFASILRPEKSPLSLWEWSKGGCQRAKFSTYKWHKRFIGKEKHIPIKLNQCRAALLFMKYPG